MLIDWCYNTLSNCHTEKYAHTMERKKNNNTCNCVGKISTDPVKAVTQNSISRSLRCCSHSIEINIHTKRQQVKLHQFCSCWIFFDIWRVKSQKQTYTSTHTHTHTGQYMALICGLCAFSSSFDIHTRPKPVQHFNWLVRITKCPMEAKERERER